MEKLITIRLPSEVFDVLDARAKGLGAATSALARQLIVDGLNNAGSDERIKAAVISTLDKKMIEYTKTVIAAVSKGSAVN